MKKWFVTAICHIPYSIVSIVLHNPFSSCHTFTHQILDFLSRCHLLLFLTVQIAAPFVLTTWLSQFSEFASPSLEVTDSPFAFYNCSDLLYSFTYSDRFMSVASWSSTTAVRTVLQLQLKSIFSLVSFHCQLASQLTSIDCNHLCISDWESERSIDHFLQPWRLNSPPDSPFCAPSYCHFAPLWPPDWVIQFWLQFSGF